MNDLQVLEQLLIANGRVIDHHALSTAFSHLSNINNKISSLIKQGLLIKLKKGVYYIAKLGSLGYTSTSAYLIANTIGQESFVSFEGSLKYHGLFDQGLKKYRSISQKQYLTKNIEDVEYSYIKVKKENYFGFQERQVDTDLVQIAEAERALLDLLEYQRTTHSVSLVLEKIQLYQSELNLSHLTDYASQFSQTSIKIMGFIFDLLQIDSSKLYQLIQSKDSTHRMFTSSAAFDKRWRLYYEEILKEQVA